MQSALTRPILSSTAKPGLIRAFTAAPAIMAAGDTGSPKPRGFLAEKDTFARREAAHEGLYIKQLEKEKIDLLRKKLKEHQKHNEELDKHLEDLLAGQGGEKN
ncbi:hypothetical protein N7478_005843 [Penicillium angulare]|uniref:uncharacterized protein n=1 Tax=Penicillium angulare TaxID=116970 RepID=UPI0025411C72|nr:uncharacterized protein N7478_005843 [Penicillium angulare]KAJ5280471.1 hypothetical protein N7478_005843 [Penicillium angulare]